MRRTQVIERTSLADAVQNLTVDVLKPLARLIADASPTRKTELVELLASAMRDEPAVRQRYASLDTLSQAAIREAVHDPNGTLDRARFQAKYGQAPRFSEEEDKPRAGFYSSSRHSKPTLLGLFFLDGTTLPLELQQMLARFVPKPVSAQIATVEELPQRVEPAWVPWSQRQKGEQESREVPLQVQETERAALHDLHAVLRLIEAGKLSVSATTKRPGQASMRAVAAILHSGDFYADEEEVDDEDSAGLAMKAFAWPLIVQAAGFANLTGSRLQLTPAGRKAMGLPAHEGLHTAWSRWLRTTLLDEFNRVNAIKGQGGKGKNQLTAVAGRRQVIVQALADCPAGSWIAVDELFRFMRATGYVFQVTRNPWSLYISQREYGSLGYDSPHSWTILQGRYVMAFLLEYAATLGLVDVAYIAPTGARKDYQSLWGADDLLYLSRYDGLRYVRINRLGAWCLGQAQRYEPEPMVAEPGLKVLPNRDVVVTGRPLAPGDVLYLERFAERSSDAVWRLSEERCLGAMEEGMSLAELMDFLTARGDVPLPQTVEVFLGDLRDRAGQLRDQGPARLIECRDAELALLLANDRRLRPLCQIAGDRHLVFRTADEPAVRRALRELGYVILRSPTSPA